MRINPPPLKQGLSTGVCKGWSAFLWTVKILVPVSFITAVLQWCGLIHTLDLLIQPLMGLLELPGMAALPIGIACVAGIYSGIAALVVLPFTKEQMTLIAIFMMISHHLITETIIQGKSGLHPVKAILFRLGTAIITVMACAQFLDTTSMASEVAPMVSSHPQPLILTLTTWGISTIRLTFRIFVIIMGLLIAFETMKALGWIRPFVNRLSPLLRCLGLSQKVGTPWIAGALFGLIYGAAIIAEELKEGQLSKEELEGLQLSVAIHHSIIEDPVIFMTMGLSPFWLVVPRLIMSILVVRLYSLSFRLKEKLHLRREPDRP